MTKKLYWPLLIVLPIFILLVLFGSSVSDTSQKKIPPVPSDPSIGRTITRTGVLTCLKHRGDGPQTLECAFGLEQDDGTVYALSADDPMRIGAIPTGSRIEATGMLMRLADEKYQTVGTIEVESVKNL